MFCRLVKQLPECDLSRGRSCMLGNSSTQCGENASAKVEGISLVRHVPHMRALTAYWYWPATSGPLSAALRRALASWQMEDF